MGRSPCCEKMGLKKGPWTPEEDQILINFIRLHGHPNWRALPKQARLLRCGKSCRLRWTNYLRPDIKRGNFTPEEEETIIKLHEQLGNRWSAIAARLPGRTDNEIKNVWHTHLKKRLPQSDQSTTGGSGEPTRKRARKPKTTKKGEVPEAPKIEHVKCMQKEDVKNEDDGNCDDNIKSNIHVGEVVSATNNVTSQPVSPQPCTSSISEISTVTSASDHHNYVHSYDNGIVCNENNVGDDQGDKCFGEDFLQMDNDFWVDVLPCIQDTAVSTKQDCLGFSRLELNSSSNHVMMMEPQGMEYLNSNIYQEDMEPNTSCNHFMMMPNTSSDHFIMMEPQGLEYSNSSIHQEDMGFFWYDLLLRSNNLTELSQVI